jgi:transposase
MRYELSDYEWTAIKPMLPNRPRGVRRVNDRRVLNGIFWVLRSGAPWRDLPETYGPRTTCYNSFVRWRQAGVWDQIMDALAAGHDAAVQMIDYFRSARAPARRLCRGQQSPGHGSLARGHDKQDSRGGGHQRPAGSSRPHARRGRTTIGCVRFSSAPCFPKRCCSRIAAMTPTGSGNLLASKEHGRTFRPNETAKTRSASAHISIARAT